MKSKIHRALSIFMAFAVCFCALPFSASASSEDVVQDVVDAVEDIKDAANFYVAPLWEFFGRNARRNFDKISQYISWFMDGWTANDVTSENLETAYDNYVTNLDTNFNTHVVSSNGIVYTLRFDHTVVNSWRGYAYILNPSSRNLYPPGIGTVEYFENFHFINCELSNPGYTYYSRSGSWDKIFAYQAGVIGVSSSNALIQVPQYQTIAFDVLVTTLPARFWGTCGWVFTPVSWATDELYDEIKLPQNRAPSLLNTIFTTNSPAQTYNYYIGTVDNSTNTVTNVYTTQIVDEQNKTVTIPGETETVYDIDTWNYDYSTRVYDLTTVNDERITVTYGDDCITIVAPNAEGVEVTQNFYYVIQEPAPTPPSSDPDTGLPLPSTDNYEDDPTTTGGFFSTIWKAFKDGLASLISGIITALFNGLKAIIDGIMNLFDGLFSRLFGSVGDFFDSFSATGVFQFFDGDLVIRGPTYVVSV